ncbi:hypothetical protein J6590_027929 [Homalodisca vitripennis]|nr:hypothetical protein J6590_027929 [Homalodisca vitripennis]
MDEIPDAIKSFGCNDCAGYIPQVEDGKTAGPRPLSFWRDLDVNLTCVVSGLATGWRSARVALSR